jgi:hypothetical protein
MITRGYGIQGGRVATETVLAHIGDLVMDEGGQLSLDDDDEQEIQMYDDGGLDLEMGGGDDDDIETDDNDGDLELSCE